MLIKSMPVKKADWNHHYNYLSQENRNKLFSWGLNVDPNDKDAVIEAYKQNYEYLKFNSKHKNKYLHEVLSLPQNNMSIEEQEKALYDLADRYIFARAENNLVIGSIHQDTDHLHMHLIISANKYMDTKSHRLSKKQFKAIQRDIEQYKNKKYSQLKTLHYQENYRAKQKQKRAEQEMKTHRKKQTKKAKVLEEFKMILNSSKTKKEFYHKLKEKQYQMYRKGKYFGLISHKDNKRNYRLNTLEKDLDLKFINRVKQMEKHQKLQYLVEQQAKIQHKGLNHEPTR
jgi:hypothetical protein